MATAKSPAWQRKEGKSESGGLNAKGRASYNRANQGLKLHNLKEDLEKNHFVVECQG